MTPPTPGELTALTIRDATPADATSVAAIYNQYIDLGDCTMDLVHRPSAEVEARIASLDTREAMLVAEIDGQTVAWGAVKKYSDREGYRICCETSVYVDSAYTRRRIGQQMMDVLFQRCRQLRYHHVLVRIFASNDGSIRFHERNGFELVGTLREVGHVQGRFVDVVIMQCILDDVSPE